MKQSLLNITSNREVSPGVFLMWLDAGSLVQQSKTGQFFMVKCGDDTTLRRPISVHRIDAEKGGLAFLYAVVGKGTQWLANSQPGENLDIFGPLGNGFTLEAKSKNVLIVAGGIGIAPLIYLAETALRAEKKVTLLLGAATARKLYPAKLVPEGVRVEFSTDDGTKGYKGLVTDLLPEYAGRAEQIFVCGPMPMLQNIAGHKKELGLAGKPVDISMEMRMACGIGVCLGCTVRTNNGLKEVCKDGPIFRLDEVIWDDLTQI